MSELPWGPPDDGRDYIFVPMAGWVLLEDADKLTDWPSILAYMPKAEKEEAP